MIATILLVLALAFAIVASINQPIGTLNTTAASLACYFASLLVHLV